MLSRIPNLSGKANGLQPSTTVVPPKVCPDGSSTDATKRRDCFPGFPLICAGKALERLYPISSVVMEEHYRQPRYFLL